VIVLKAQEHTRRVLARYTHQQRTAAFPPFAKEGPPPPPPGAGDQKRNIPTDHSYDPKALKPLAESLWASTVSLGHALAAYRHFSRLKSTTISPDGKIGGRGYIMNITDVRQKLYNACEALSAVSDTIYDEISAPHWKPKLAMLDENDAEDVERFIEKSQQTLASPEDAAEKEIDNIEKENDKPAEGKGGEDETSSKMPGPQGPSEEVAQAQPEPGGQRTKEASSIPVEQLSGPRVTQYDSGPGPFGSYNTPDDVADDHWG